MPEMLEVESYRTLAERAIGRSVASVEAPDPFILKRGLTSSVLADAVCGARIRSVRRIGKLMLLDLVDRPTVGLHFGMTGRLVLDGDSAVEELVYGSRRVEERWIRLRLRLDGGGALELHDPRRLGRVELDPDEGRLGPDAGSLNMRVLRPLLSHSSAPVKAALMDQSRIAGLGNLMTDEILWFAGIAPTRPARDLSDDEVRRLLAAIRRTIRILGRRGGSHTGDTFGERHVAGHCPREGTPMVHGTVGGRSTWWCAEHQS